METKKKAGRKKDSIVEERNKDDRARKYAQLAALGMKSKQIQNSFGFKSQNSLKPLRNRAIEKGYLQKLQDERDERVVDIRAEVKEIADNCTLYMKAVTEIAVTRICRELQKQNDPEINIAEAKLITDLFNSTEYSGKKQDAPTVTVDVTANSEVKIEIAAQKIDQILSRYLK